MTLRIPVIASLQAEWNRRAADAVNQALTRLGTAETTLATAVLEDGATIYAGDTAAGAYDQTQIQALMDAVEALSARLEG